MLSRRSTLSPDSDWSRPGTVLASRRRIRHREGRPLCAVLLLFRTMLALEHYGYGLVLFLAVARLAYGNELQPFPLSDRELLIEAGYYDEHGVYQGGIPSFRNSEQTNDCKSMNGTVCDFWETRQSPTDEEYLICECTSMAGRTYCSKWSCSRVKNSAPECEGDGCLVMMGVDTTSCECDSAVKSSRYCAEWWCGESAPDGSYGIEEYKCASGSSSGKYCTSWTREVDSNSRLEVSACDCTQEQNDGCSYWKCRDRSIRKCGGVCDVRVAVGVGGTLGLLVGVLLFYAIKDGGILCSLILLSFILAAAASVVYWGGQAGAIYVAIMWGIPLLVKAFCLCCRKKEQ